MPWVVAIFCSYLWVPSSHFYSLSPSVLVQLIPYIKSPPLKYPVRFSCLYDCTLTETGPESLWDKALASAWCSGPKMTWPQHMPPSHFRCCPGCTLNSSLTVLLHLTADTALSSSLFCTCSAWKLLYAPPRSYSSAGAFLPLESFADTGFLFIPQLDKVPFFVLPSILHFFYYST